MALNEKAYFPQPDKGKTVGTSITVSGGGTTTTTILTVGAGQVLKVKDFILTVELTKSGAGANEIAKGTITIGTAKYVLGADLESDTDTHFYTFTSLDLGFQGSFIQTGDVITLSATATGTPTLAIVAIGLSIDDYST